MCVCVFFFFTINSIGVVTGNSVALNAFWINEACHDSKAQNFQSLKVKVRLVVVSHLK